ncbi:MAG: insulinase family protein [Ignavibacteriae bacterium]|nr:MAG: insulinase family protein [Ignavibacteriota bacterium]
MLFVLYSRISIFILIMMFFKQSTLISQVNVDFVEYDLENGLHVILTKDNSNPIVSIDIWYHVGSKDEDTNRTGFAHLFEHMMFQGSDNVGKAEHFSYVQKAGGTVNGTTNQDRTNYFESLPSNQLELALWLESDRMSTLNVTQENFDNQREVVKEEKRQRYDNVPYGTRFYNLFKLAFKNQPYGWIPIGSMEHLNDADLSYAQNFYNRFYNPNNAVLVISGDIEYDKTKVLVNKYFGGLANGPEVNRNYSSVIFNQGEIRDTVYDNIQIPALYIGYKIPGVTSKDIYPLALLSSVLSSGRSSRLYGELVYKKKLAKSVNAFIWDLELGGLFIITATALKGTDLNDIEKVINEEIEKINNENITAKELEKVKNSSESEFTNRALTDLGKADMLANYWTFYKNTSLINSDINNYLNVKEEDIKNTASKFLNNNNRVVLYYLPKNNK